MGALGNINRMISGLGVEGEKVLNVNIKNHYKMDRINAAAV